MHSPLRYARIILAGLLVPALALAQEQLPPGSAAPKAVRAAETLKELPIGYAALALEQEVGVDVSVPTRLLDRALESAQRRLPARPAPAEAFAAISAAVSEACAERSSGSGAGLYAAALRSGVCDCDALTLTYLTIGEALDLPLHAALLPGHMLVVWDGDERLFWETTTGEARPEWLLAHRAPPAAREGVYLRPLRKDELVGYLYSLRAAYRLDSGSPAEALADFDRALELGPTLVHAASNRGRAYLLDGAFDRAAADFNRALELDPGFADAAYGRGAAALALGDAEAALEDFDRVLALEGPTADALYMRGAAYSDLGRDRAALASFTAALAADPTLAVAYEARAALHERRGAVPEARRDYAAFIHHAEGTPHAARAAHTRERMLALARTEPDDTDAAGWSFVYFEDALFEGDGALSGGRHAW